jgi:hypothetical protein
MPRYAPNRMPLAVKRRYFELIRRVCPARLRPSWSGWGVVELWVVVVH